MRQLGCVVLLAALACGHHQGAAPADAAGAADALADAPGDAPGNGPSFHCVPAIPTTQVISDPGAQAIAIADLNNDHHADLITANTTDDQLAILFADGSGGFRSPVFMATAAQPFQVRTADLNKDGNSDVVSVNFPFQVGATGSITVYLGHGDGTFSSTPYPLSWSPVDAAIGDIDGNGTPDIVVVGSLVTTAAPEIAVLTNDGAGRFSSYANITSQSVETPESVRIADFDGDHRPDIAVGMFGGNGLGLACVYLNRGAGNFAAPSCTATPPAPENSAGIINIAVADFDGDGHPDIAATEPAPPPGAMMGAAGPLQVFFGKGDGTLSPPVTERSVSNAGALVVGDLNGDGAPDLVAQQQGSTEVSVLLNHGNGTFEPTTYAGVAVGSAPQGINGLEEGLALGDLDGDGKLDLAISWVGSLVTTAGRGDGTFAQRAVLYFGAPILGGALADLDGDGKLDTVFAAAGTPFEPGIVPVLYGNGDGTFTEQSQHLQAPYYSSVPDVTVADVTGDGKPDILLSDLYGLVLLQNEGNRVFAPAPTIQWPHGGGPVEVGDVNGDGLPDLVGGNGQLYTALGQGSGTYALPISAAPQIGTGVALLGDFNQDGHLDAVVYAGDAAMLMEGHGDGTFAPTTQIPLGRAITSAHLVRGDVLDLVGVYCNNFGCVIGVLLGHGDGTFAPAITYSTGDISAFSVSDVDGDSLPDLVAASTLGPLGGYTLSIIRNEGSGHFAPPITYPIDIPLQQILLGDLDGDSHADLLMVTQSGTISASLEVCAREAALPPRQLSP